MENDSEDLLQLDGECEFAIFKSCCRCCYHLIDKENKRCKAFPDGIPEEIWNGGFNHLIEYPGDNGIQYMNKDHMYLYGEEYEEECLREEIEKVQKIQEKMKQI